MGLIIFTATSGLAEINPIGGFVTGSLETTSRINKRLKKIQRVVIDPLPVSRKDFGNPAQQMGRQKVTTDPGQYKKSAVVGNKADIVSANSRGPADEPVSASDVTGRRRPGKTGNRSAVGKDNIFKMLSHWMAIAQIMMLGY